MKDDEHKREGQTGTPAVKDPGKDPTKDPRKDPRRDRLKLALRENLKRRKSQMRGRGDVTIAPSNTYKVSLDEDSEKKPGK
jgi:hypothetical protein